MKKYILMIIFSFGLIPFSRYAVSFEGMASQVKKYDQSTPEALAQTYIEAVNNSDKEGLQSLIHPDVLKYAIDHENEIFITDLINREIEKTIPKDIAVKIVDYSSGSVDPKYIFHPHPMKDMRLNWSQEISGSTNKKFYAVVHSFSKLDSKWYMTIPLYTEAGKIKAQEMIEEQQKKYKETVQTAVSTLLNSEGKSSQDINHAINTALNYKPETRIIKEMEIIDKQSGKKYLEKHYISPDLGIVLIYSNGAFDRVTKIE